MEYFIHNVEGIDGPHDYMAMVRKIRNQTLQEDTLIGTADSEPAMPASSFKEFHPFFQSQAAEQHQGEVTKKTLFSLLAHGTDFIKNNMGVILYTAVFMLLWLLLWLVFIYQSGTFSITCGIMLSYFFVGPYLYGFVRFVHGNPVQVSDLVGRSIATLVPMGVVSIIVAMLMLPAVVFIHSVIGNEQSTMGAGLIGLVILVLLLLVILTFFIFAPLQVVDRGVDFWDAIVSSTKVVLANKAYNLGIIFALLSLNALLLPLMPIILPITMAAIVELYDDYFLHS